MNRIDIAGVAIGLAALGFAIVLFLAPDIPDRLMPPLLAAILVGAGIVGLLSSLSRTNTK